MKEKIIGIMGAMPEEVQGVVDLLAEKEECEIGMRTYFSGKINGIKTIVVFSRWGKVAAAATASTLILRFHVTEIIFTGVAGAIHSDLNVGDIVIGKRLIQHDLDGRPLMKEFEIPLLNIAYLKILDKQLETASFAVHHLLDENRLHAVINAEELAKFGITVPKLIVGDIASGDKFFSNTAEKGALIKKLPSILCVEMEGAAVAQIGYEYDVPVTVIRTISDAADEKSAIDFTAFIEQVSNKYSVEIIKTIFRENNASS